MCTLKRVLSISEVKTLYNACVDRGVNVASTYDVLVATLEETLARRFAVDEDELAIPATPHVPLTDANGVEVAPDLSRLMSAAVEAVADKVYVEQTLSQVR